MRRLWLLFGCLLLAAAPAVQRRDKVTTQPKLSHLHITVSDLNRSIQFYRDKLGFALQMQQADFAYLDVGDNKTLFLDAAKGSRRVAPEGTTLGFRTDSVDQQYELLKRRGVPLLGSPENRPYGVRSFYFTDPDGYVIEYEQVLPK